ncbi:MULTISPECIES: thiamine ABC transporter substrate-binding protein [Thermocrispum]|uniref:Thiamine ABC transporter substrate-binding protein n=1 Tax=Thermocrispum agreste TaxID=37925 RepID=A0A2W4J5M2_9PSEU|nr:MULTISPECIES: thiamine ABC transporter substrate-binding protein [Thermocrispum]PZM94570.1 MAG: thiamine ABC transporter substrate-binding protein [Thermocrispum agreste]
MINRVRRAKVPALLLTLGMVAAGCGTDEPQRPEEQRTVTLVTDSSWTIPQELHAAFERQTELQLEHRTIGDTPTELVEALGKITAGDVVLGLDTSTVQQALRDDVLTPYTSPEANRGQQRFSVDEQQRLSAIDRLVVCVNVDETWFTEHDVPPPESAEDLADPAYRGLLAMPDPKTSQHGMTYLLGSIAQQGRGGWQRYWKRLKNNGVTVLPTDADVRQQYTATGGKGEHPLVIASATLPGQLSGDEGGRTSVLEDTCHEQVRYAAVLASADSDERAGKLVDFLLTQQFQQAVPEAYGTYPVRMGVELPEEWADKVPAPEEPGALPARAADAGRKQVLARWQQVMGG